MAKFLDALQRLQLKLAVRVVELEAEQEEYDLLLKEFREQLELEKAKRSIANKSWWSRIVRWWRDNRA